MLAVACGALWVTTALVGCGEERSVPVVTGAGASGGTGGKSGSGGEGGEDASGASGASTDGGSSPGGAPNGEGGSDAGAGGAVIPPIDTACAGDRAFAAVSGAFVDPTPQAFALALNEAVFGLVPMSFVLRNDGGVAKAAASYTIVDDGAHSFVEAMAPDFVPAWIAEGGFGTISSQNRGYLLVQLEDGPLEVPLDNVSFVATTREGCTRGVVSMTGVLPPENADLVARITGTAAEDGAAEEARTPEAAVMVSALFSVELVEFDFEASP